MRSNKIWRQVGKIRSMPDPKGFWRAKATLFFMVAIGAGLIWLGSNLDVRFYLAYIGLGACTYLYTNLTKSDWVESPVRSLTMCLLALFPIGFFWLAIACYYLMYASWRSEKYRYWTAWDLIKTWPLMQPSSSCRMAGYTTPTPREDGPSTTN